MKRILERRSKSTLGLMEMIREECILLDVEAENWEEAVRKSAEPLIAHGYIEPRYLTAMLKNIRKWARMSWSRQASPFRILCRRMACFALA